MRREHLLASQADPLYQPQHEGVGSAVLERGAGGAVEAQERAGAVAPLLGQLRALERGGHRRRHVELAPPSELGEPSDVDRAQLYRWSAERADDGARVVWVGERSQPGEHVAHLGALEVRGCAAGPKRNGALLERPSTQTSSGATPPAISCSASAATAWA